MNKKPRTSLYTLLAVVGALGLVVAGGCKKDEKKDAKPATPAAKEPMKHDMGKMDHDTAKTAPPAGDAPAMDPAKMANARKVDVKVDAEGFKPDSIPAKAGEHLKLVFTRISEKGCGTEVVLADSGKKYELPLNKPVEVPVMAGKEGEVTFACGMNMMKGKVVVQ